MHQFVYTIQLSHLTVDTPNCGHPLAVDALTMDWGHSTLSGLCLCRYIQLTQFLQNGLSQIFFVLFLYFLQVPGVPAMYDYGGGGGGGVHVPYSRNFRWL